jgi:hypothetical protein
MERASRSPKHLLGKFESFPAAIPLTNIPLTFQFSERIPRNQPRA